jgi:hypothetical protein
MIDFDKLATDAKIVSDEYEMLTAAINEEHKAEVGLLKRVVETIRPALKALVDEIVVYERTWWPDSISTDTEERHHDVPGVRVEGGDPEKDYPRAGRGAWQGKALYLLADGSFVVVKYHGSWSNWQGGTSEMQAEVISRKLEEVVNGWDVDAIIKKIVETLASHVGKRADATKEAHERARKLAAVTALL